MSPAATTIQNASPVSVSVAQQVAMNFYGQNSPHQASSATLVYTEKDNAGNPVYYVFDINGTEGFVIISAYKQLQPIIGYSNEGRPYVIPQEGSNFGFWMQKRKTEIIADMNTKNIAADAEIKDEWTSYINNKVPQSVQKMNTRKATSVTFPSSTAYLVQSTWNQNPSPYNTFCPGASNNRSVTGCVATAMAQIMRYWQYPASGQSSSSYNCPNYGTLSANYAHTYNWTKMTLTNPASNDTDLARLMSDCGISVDMQYSPTGSGSYVLTQDNANSAQNSYVKYFKYSSKILDGHYATVMSSTAWTDTIKHELDRNRPVQYLGADPNEGGHTWVCDGYNSSSQFHMNWGWGGASDGWYALNNLAPSGQTLNFSQNLGALIGIMPPAAAPVADFSASAVTIPVGTKINYTDLSTNSPTSWAWTFNGAATTSSTVQNPTGIQYNTVGKYTTTLKATNANGSNTATKTNYINVVSGSACDTLSNLPSTAYLTYYGAGSGFVTGIYGDTVQKIAEYFANAPSPGFTIGSVDIYFGVAYQKTTGQTVTVNIYNNTGTSGAPGTVIASQSLPVSSISTSALTHVTFSSPVTVTTPYYVGVDFTTMASNYQNDSLAVVSDTNNQGTATAWQYDVASKYGLNGWVTVANTWGINISQAIWVNMCSNPTEAYTYDLGAGVKLYPNPTSGKINAAVSLDEAKDVDVKVFNTLGQMIQQQHWGNVTNSVYTIDLSNQPNGMYFVKLITDKTTITRKVMVNR